MLPPPTSPVPVQEVTQTPQLCAMVLGTCLPFLCRLLQTYLNPGREGEAVLQPPHKLVEVHAGKKKLELLRVKLRPWDGGAALTSAASL